MRPAEDAAREMIVEPADEQEEEIYSFFVRVRDGDHSRPVAAQLPGKWIEDPKERAATATSNAVRWLAGIIKRSRAEGAADALAYSERRINDICAMVGDIPRPELCETAYDRIIHAISELRHRAEQAEEAAAQLRKAKYVVKVER